MNQLKNYVPYKLVLTMALAVSAPWALAVEQFSKFAPIIEINATDGDVGYHVLLDGSGWKVAKIFDSDGDRMFKGRGTDDLLEQGITELFMESAEPPCNPEDADEDETAVTLAEFLDRFEAGIYKARGRTIEGEPLIARAEFTHNIPAAPDAEVEVEIEDDEVEVVISWEGGDDLGRCEFAGLVEAGAIPHPQDVEVVRWEVVVEPEDDELPEGVIFAKISMQFPVGVNEAEMPDEFFQRYLELGVTEFKGEVGAREAGGNQTFTEFEFSLEDEDDDD